MALDRQEYPAILASLSPAQAIDVLSERVRAVAQINTGIADWLQERRRIEEQYATSLRKLARRPAIADPQTLGIFATPISALIASIDTLADTHHQLASKIDSDVEQPLRLFNTTNREMTAMGNIQGNLTSLSKDIESAQKKVDKASKAGGPKFETARRDAESAVSQWESQAPFVFESLQALDESRINHLRDVLTQFQTHEVDQNEKIRAATERSLNILLTIETSEEIQSFAERAAKAGSGSTAASQAGSRRNTITGAGPPSLAPESAPAMPRTPATPAVAALSSPARGLDDNRSQRSDSVSELPTPKSKARSGLRRLGTVLKGRRESKIPMGADRISESPERASPENRKSRLPNSSTFSSFTRGMRSRDNITSLEPPKEEERARSPLRAVSSRGVDEGPTKVNGGAGTAGTTNGDYQNDLGGLSLTQSSLQDDISSGLESNKVEKGNGAAIDPITAAELEASATGSSSGGAFKVAIKDAPTTQEPADEDTLTSMASTLKLQGPPVVGSRKQGTVRGRRDNNRASVYNSLSTPPALSSMGQDSASFSATPISEASEVIATPPAAPTPQQIPQQAPPSYPTIARSNPAIAAATGSALPSSPFASAIRPGSAPLADDSGSVRSGRSQSSVASVSHRHPDLTASGLNASIIETVSAWFEDGRLGRSAVIGEVALQHNDSPAGLAGDSAQVSLRIAGVTDADKVAPNPAFISNDHSQQGAGTYALSIPQLGRGRTQVAFKYQLSPSSPAAVGGTLVPLSLHAVWKVEPAQTSVILSYSLNEAFAAADSALTAGGAAAVALKDVTLALHLGDGGGKATSCLSKPVGTFNRERGVIYWALGDVVLRAGEGPSKVIARFATEGGAGKAGRAEARWTAEGRGSAVKVLVKGEAADSGDDPFGDAARDGWNEVDGRRRLVAGTYTAVSL